VAFAIENVPTTGWLPLQLRAKGYDGPPVKGKVLARRPGRQGEGAGEGKAKKAAEARRGEKVCEENLGEKEALIASLHRGRNP
jgi:ParB family chromosome partitioning protein